MGINKNNNIKLFCHKCNTFSASSAGIQSEMEGRAQPKA